MSYPVRAITTPELALLQSDGQHCQILMDVLSPATVFSGTATFTGSIDRVVQVAYTPVSGSYTAIQPGMELLVGSTPGARDLGRARIRKAADASYIYIGETSDILFATGVYLTVTNNYGLWARQPNVNGQTWFMDWDIPYSDQYSIPDPVPVMGPTAAVLYLSSGSARVQMNGTDAWCINDRIASYSWSTSSGSVISPTSASPTFVFTSAGSYLVNCTVTSGSGRTNTGHRYVFVHDDNNVPISNFVMNSCTGETDTGAWTAQLTLYDTASFSLIQDAAFIVLHTKDYYGSSASSIGQIPGYENILFEGWIDGQSIDYNGEIGSLKFTCRNSGGWLDKITLRPFSLKDQNTGADTWIYLRKLTSDLAAWTIAHWRSTIDTVVDFRASGDTRYVAGEDAQIGTIWWQLQQIGYHIFANPEADRFNRLFFEVDCQMLPYASRAVIPTIQTITKADWFDVQSITRVTQTPVSILDVSGSYWNMEALGGTVQPIDFYGVPLYSRHPGTSPHQFGKPQTKDRLAFISQTDANTVCGLLGGKMNNEYPNVAISLAENNRMFDITPCMYAIINLDAADNPRGLSWSGKRFIPDRITYKHDPAKGGLTVDMEFAAETFQLSSTTIIKPVVTQPGLGNFGIGNANSFSTFPMTFTPSTWFPNTVSPIKTTPKTDCLSQDLPTGAFDLVFNQTSINPGDYTYAWCHCMVRKNTSSNRSYIALYLVETGLTSTVIVDAIDANKNVIMSGVITDTGLGYLSIAFNNTNDTEVWGFKITNAGVVSSGSWWIDTGQGIAGGGSWDRSSANPVTWTGAEIAGWLGHVGSTLYGVAYAVDGVAVLDSHNTGDWYFMFTMTAPNLGGYNIQRQYVTNYPNTTIHHCELSPTGLGATIEANLMAQAFPGYIFRQGGESWSGAKSSWQNATSLQLYHETYPGNTLDPFTVMAYPLLYGSPPASSNITLNGNQPLYNVCGVS